ncbi:tRNA (Uracil-5-)-methyltransferase [Clostridium gasigenes]|uniref:tRNA (Uracil-5-)-methyltransferase n=1 Tax=Clostridium gasigenes TaxID=94869 RepID=A0A1H0QKE0_9CLOT|nr:tRNA (Uracil-5-)-methyltransferase [Clostridium gasigenes]
MISELTELIYLCFQLEKDQNQLINFLFDALEGTEFTENEMVNGDCKVYEKIPLSKYRGYTKAEKENAKENKIYNAEFLVGTAEEKIQELLDQGVKPDTIVVDPPRKGCDIKLLEAIAQAKPKNVVYISCDPSTLARDLKILTEKGFKAGKIQPVDMFPHTPHIECVVKLKRK